MTPITLPVLLSAFAVILSAAFLLYRRFRKRPTEAELERARRTAINDTGKLGDAEIIDVEGASVIYSYQVSGVSYTAAQDVSSLESILPSDLMSMIGPVGVKYDRRQPANSIVICESWSGLAERRAE